MVPVFQIKTVVVIGSGNVAWHLTQALHKAGKEILQVCSPRREHAGILAEKVGAATAMRCEKVVANADFYLLAVPDGKIEEVAGHLPDVKGMVCHTSGITPAVVLERFERYGVFYPLQTFSKGKPVELQEVPFCLEASSPAGYSALETVAAALSRRVYSVTTEKRMKLHLAAVLVNNFTNHLFAQAEGFLEQNGLEREMLMPLMRETVEKLKALPASEAQTGPARRGDRATLRKHLEMLHAHPDLKAVYQLFSEQILKKYYE